MTIRLEDIVKEYGLVNKKRVLDHLSLDFTDDKIILIFGKSGIGKSTLLKIIGLLDFSFKGSYYLGKRELFSYKKSEREVLRAKYFTHIFQEYELIENESVFENVALALGTELEGPLLLSNIKDILALLEIDEFIYQRVSRLSGGQRQRVAVARALSVNRRFVLADEPTSSVDRASKEVILKALDEYSKKDEKRKIFIASHDESLIEYFKEARVIELT